jgi:hypothetical protein
MAAPKALNFVFLKKGNHIHSLSSRLMSILARLLRIFYVHAYNVYLQIHWVTWRKHQFDIGILVAPYQVHYLIGIKISKHFAQGHISDKIFPGNL